MRRRLVLGGAALGGLLAGPATATGRQFGARPSGYGSRSPHETATRAAVQYQIEANGSLAPIASQYGIVTPSGLHFERHHAGIPDIDPAAHTLTIHGMVDRPLRFSVADLKRFPSVSRFHFVECSGNTAVEWHRATMPDVQGTHGLISCSEWTGVPLAMLLKEAGIGHGAAWVLAEGADACLMTRSIPLAKCLDDALVVYGQNGEALRPEQGYPLRLLLPGWEGNASIKWLRRLELGDKPFMSREETSMYSDLRGDGSAVQFTFEMGVKSVITQPSGGMHLEEKGFHEIRGLAWSGAGRISAVEVSTDGGRSWQSAQLQAPVLSKCLTRFRLPWRWRGEPVMLQSRCRDQSGAVQPTIAELRRQRGLDDKARSDYHQNGIQSWLVTADGAVSNGNHQLAPA